LDVASEGAVAEARMSFGRRVDGGDFECVRDEDAIVTVEKELVSLLKKEVHNIGSG
jgi:hypothetical protein